MSPEKISKRQERRAKMARQHRQQRLIIIGVIVLGAALVVFAAVWPQFKSVGEIITVTPAALPNPNGLSLGDAKAPATIDVFEDFQCPACRSFTENTEPLVIENLVSTGKARYVFHNYPFLDDRLGKGGESDQAANASMCANEQSKFWDMHAMLFTNWNGENQGSFSDRRLQAMAETLGLDMNAFNSCFSANKYEADIQADLDKGKELGVSGTPTVFVNEKKVGQGNSVPSYQDIAQAVEAAGAGQ
jgi:protein-disulfide isomerase